MSNNNHRYISINFSGHELLLLASGGCYWPSQKTLIVSDLHLEKGSYLATHGQPLPLADTRDTLEKLQQDLTYWQPETVICLGDNVHDAQAFTRMKMEDLLFLESLYTSVSNWKWIIGNHDKVQIQDYPFQNRQFYSDIIIDTICFSHDFQKERPVQIIGHYHPKISIKKQGMRITGKCFSVTPSLMIMPAFGSYTGGLDIQDKIYETILKKSANYYLIFNQDIFLVK